jgi:endonuclease YncB( thermonuclease family)
MSILSCLVLGWRMFLRAKLIGLGAVVLALFWLAALPALAQEISGTARVIEQTGLNDGQEYRCALIAAGRLAEKIAGRKVSCEAHSTDDEGRMLASCFIRKRENLSGWLVNKGYVVIDSRYSEEFSDWEVWNSNAGAGLWSGSFELP